MATLKNRSVLIMIWFLCLNWPAIVSAETTFLALNETETEPSRVILQVPTGVFASDGTLAQEVKISWDVVPGAKWYEVYASSSSLGEKKWIGSTWNRSLIFPNTSMDTSYFWVRASNIDGIGDFSDYDTGYPGPAVTVPEVPENVVASDGIYENKIFIFWNASRGATYYDVFRSTKPVSMGGKMELVGSSPETNFTDVTAMPDTSYYYWIVAKNSFSGSGYSSFDTGYWQYLDTPEMPENVIASYGTYGNIIRVTWESANGADFYEVYRDTSPEGAGREFIGSVSVSYFDDSEETCGQYYYWVKAVNAMGSSEFGNSAKGLKSGCGPQDLTASYDSGSKGVVLSWSEPGDKLSYRIYRGKLHSAMALIATTGAPFYIDRAVSPGKQYMYEVEVLDRYGIKTSTTNSALIKFGVINHSDPYEIDRILSPEGSSEFGRFIAVSGNTLLVNPGYVYEKDDTGKWTQTAKLESPGWRWINNVHLSGDMASLGTSSSDETHIFLRAKNGLWFYNATLQLPVSYGIHPETGYPTDLQGNTVVIGNNRIMHCYGYGCEFYGNNKAYVFEKNQYGLWGDATELSGSDDGDYDFFGQSVAVYGNTVMVGSSRALYVFEKEADGKWREIQKLEARDSPDYFGVTVEIDGNTAMVGATGSVYVFERKESGLWFQTATFASECHSVISLNDDVAVIGGAYNGKTNVYKKRDDNTWTELAILDAKGFSGGTNRFISQASGISDGSIFLGSLDYDCHASVYDSTICEATGPGSVAVYDIDKILPPALPVNVSASAGEYKDKIRISWETSPDVISCEIYRSATPTSEKIKIGQSKSNTFTDTHLAGETRYYYWVKAVGEFGESDFSSGVVGSVVVEDGGDTGSGDDGSDPGTSDPAEAGSSGGGCFINGLQD